MKFKLYLYASLLFTISACQKNQNETKIKSEHSIEVVGKLVLNQGVCYEDGTHQRGVNEYSLYDTKTGVEYQLLGNAETIALIEKTTIGSLIKVQGELSGDKKVELSYFNVISAKGKPSGGGNGGGGNGGGSGGPTARTVLAIRMNSPEFPAPKTEAEINDMIFTATNSVNQFYQTVSEGEVEITGEVISLEMPSTSETCPSILFKDDADVQLANLGHDLSTYDHIVYLFPFTCSVCGHNSIGSNVARVWCITPKTIAHEMGHALGLEHSLSDLPSENGDASCTMGSRYSEFNAVKKAFLGYISTTNVSKKGGTYTVLNASNHTQSGSKACVLSIGNTKYYISYRSETGVFDAGLPSTYSDQVSIHSIDGGPSRTITLSTLELGELYVIGQYTITFDALNNDAATVTVAK